MSLSNSNTKNTGQNIDLGFILQHLSPVALREVGLAPITGDGKYGDDSDSGDDSDTLPIAKLEVWSKKYLRYLERKTDFSRITVRDRKALINRFLNFLKEREFEVCGPDELCEYFYYLREQHKYGEEPLSPSSIASYYRNLKPVFSWFVEQGVLAKSPFLKVTKPKDGDPQKEPLSDRTVDALIRACAGSQYPERDEALIFFMLDTGCRNSEIGSLRLKDIHLDQGSATVIGKGNKKRPVYFTQFTAQKIQKYLDKEGRNKRDKGYLFLNRWGNAFTKDALNDVIRRLAGRAGLTSEVTVHAFRRTFAVEMLRNKAHVFAVQRALGHSDLKTTQIYSKIAHSDVERQHQFASPVNRFIGQEEGAVRSVTGPSSAQLEAGHV